MQDLPDAVFRELEHPGEKQEIRQEFAGRFFFNPGQATNKAVSKIYEYGRFMAYLALPSSRICIRKCNFVFGLIF